MLKHLVIASIALFMFTSINAQDNYKPDKRLSECFTSEELSQMVSSKSELIPYYNYYLNHSYYAVNLKTAQKKVTGTDIHTVTERTNGKEAGAKFNMSTYSKETFNPLKYNFNLQRIGFITYIWKEAGVAIVFYPLQQISNAYKAFTKKTK
jgi:hypothetical protein